MRTLSIRARFAGTLLPGTLLPGTQLPKTLLPKTLLSWILVLLLTLFVAGPSVAADQAGAESVPSTPANDAEASLPEADQTQQATGDGDTADGKPSDSARILKAAYQFSRGKLLADEGNFDAALKAYQQALKLDDSDPYSRLEVAKFHSYLAQVSRSTQKKLDHLESAASLASEARQMAEGNLEILSTYAQVNLRLGEHQLGALELAQGAYEELRGKTQGDLQVLISLGQIYLWKQEADKAVEVLEEAVSYLPNHRMIHTMLLEALMETGRKRDAEGILEKLIRIEPDSIDHYFRLAELRNERGDHQAAAEGLAAAPEDLQASPRLRRILAQELHLSGDNEQAWAMLEKLWEENPGGSGLQRLRVAVLSSLTRYDEAVQELEAVLATEKDEARILQGTLHLSRLLERTGRGETAIKVLRERIPAYEAGGQLQLKLSLIGVLERQNLADDGLEMLSQEVAAASADQLPMLSYALSDLLSRMERTEEALTVLDEAIERLGDNVESIERLELRRLSLMAGAELWTRLADEAPSLFEAPSDDVRLAARSLHVEALAGLNRIDDALASLASSEGDFSASSQQARRAQLLLDDGQEAGARAILEEIAASEEAEAVFLAAQIYQRAERYSDSIPLLERLLKDNNDSRQALFLLGAAQERSGQRPAAIATFQRLLEMSPDHTPTLNYLGYMWAEKSENLDEAVTLILRAVAQEPDNGAYVDSLGWAYYQLGRYQEARRHLEWAARLVPDDATIFEHLGDLYLALEEIEQARDSYRAALDLEADNSEELRQKLQVLDEKGS